MLEMEEEMMRRLEQMRRDNQQKEATIADIAASCLSMARQKTELSRKNEQLEVLLHEQQSAAEQLEEQWAHQQNVKIASLAQAKEEQQRLLSNIRTLEAELERVPMLDTGALFRAGRPRHGWRRKRPAWAECSGRAPWGRVSHT